MSSAMYEEGLHIVPDIKTTQVRLGSLLALRRAARQAFDKALSLSRSAIGWVVATFHRWVEATAGVGVFSWLRVQVGNVAGLIRAAGAVPLAAAFLSAPPVAAAAARLARFVSNGLRRVASAAWTGLKALLGRCGRTGAQISESLSRIATQVAGVVRAIAAHPLMAPVVSALRAALALLRPISHGFVAHKVLRGLVPILWLRTLIGLLLIPFLADSTLAGKVHEFVRTPEADVTRDRNLDTLAAFGPTKVVPMPGNANTPNGDGEQTDDPSLNRASRRAQQREDARAKRTPQRH